MFDIYLTETGHSGSFSAQSLISTVGTLAFRFSGPLRIVVESLDVKPGLNFRKIAYKLLDSLHEYAYYKNCRLIFNCPNAKAINDQQIAHELAELEILKEKVA